MWLVVSGTCTKQMKIPRRSAAECDQLLEKDQILKEIDALNELADNCNQEAEILIKEYKRGEMKQILNTANV